jgi:large subunit ribosomal protein L24
MPARIKSGDDVFVVSGKDRGKKGKVLSVNPAKDKAIVEGLNLVKRHQKPQPGTLQGGGVIEKPAPIHLSNLMLVDPKTGKPTRVGIEIIDGVRHRVARPSGARLDD